MIREEEALAMDIAMQQDSDNSNPSIWTREKENTKSFFNKIQYSR
jgi:hypothetical protein